MNSFGLGLILNFTDNASSGMSNATRTFQQMSATADSVASSVSTSISSIVAASYALDSVGSTMLNTGSSILSLYGNVAQSVIDSGMQMQGYRMQLSALYGSVEAGEQKIQEIKDYAMSSVFDIQSLIPAVTTMKAVGIEALNEITTSSGQNTQKLLDYASDLAAMMPNMRNVYGTGVQAAMGAFKEYIAEGNSLSLKRGAGLDIESILGESKGSTIEARTQQVADLIEKLNIVGYTANLAGTPTQRLSNMQDALFNSLTKIADSGVFEKYCDLLEKLSNWVFSLVENEESFNTITGVLADTVTAFLSPIESFLDLVIENGDALIDWIEAHPKLTKNILLTVAAIGGFLIVGGMFLKLVSMVGMASAGFEFLKGLPTILSTVGAGFRGLVLKALPFLALAGLAYYAWSENLFGIKDTITDVVGDLGSIFSLVSDAWDDNTLSQENYDLANSLGILPLIESLLQFKYYWGFFVDGFKTGFSELFKSLEETLGTFGIDIVPLFEKVGEFLKSLFEIGQEDKWTNIGKVVGKIAGIAVSLLAVFKVLSLFKGLFSLFKGGLPLIGKGKAGANSGTAFDGITGLFSGLAKAKPTTVLKGMLNLGIILGGMTIIATAIMAVSPYLSELTDVKSFLKVAGALVILGVVGAVLAKVSQIVGKISVGAVAKGLANLAIVTVGLGAVLWAMSYAFPNGINIKQILEVIVLITVLGVVGTVLSVFAALVGLIPFAKVATGTANMAIIMVGLGAVLWAMQFAFQGGINVGLIVQVIALITILGVVSTVLSVLAGLIGLIPVATVALGLANMVIIMAGLGAVLWAMSELFESGIDVGKMVEVIAIISILGVVGSVLTAIAAIVGLIPFPVVLSGIASIVTVIGALTGLALVVSEALPTIGDNISKFATSLRPAFDAFSSLKGLDMAGIGSFFTSLGAFMLQLSGDKILSFFTGGTDLASVAKELVEFATISKGAFDTFAQFPKGSIDAVKDTVSALEALGGSGITDLVESKNLEKIGEQFNNFSISLKESFTGFPNINTGIITVLNSCTAESLQIMTTFSNKGYGIGRSLMQAIASSITTNAYRVRNALQNSLGSISVTATPSVTVQSATPNMVGLSTGGYVKETGIAVLHPDEVVVNDDLTRELRSFLSHQSSISSSGNSSNNFNSNRGEVKNDYSVTFSAGSIVIQLANATEAELEKAAEKLMKIIERKQQLKAMAVRA